MAKSGVFDEDPVTVTNKAMELKKELQKFVKAIVEEDDVNFDAIEKAQKMLSSLKELKLKKNSVSLKMVCGTVPDEFKCPISKELMWDPVIVSTGQTYDRPFILKWLKSGNRTCPQTQQVLSHTILTPNHLIRELISQWCKNNGIKIPESVPYTNEEGITEADKGHFLSLLDKISSTDTTLSNQSEAAKELRQLTKRLPSFRALFGESLLSIPQLLTPLTEKTEIPPELQEDIITTVLNLSLHDSNKKLVGETPMAISLLLEALKPGKIEIRNNAAAALFSLSALDSNKKLIGESGAFKPLIELINEGHPVAMKDAGSAIFNLCILHENRARAVKDGAVKVIFNKIKSRMHVDELLAILALLSTNQRAIEEMGDLGAVSCLLTLIRETSCDRNKENSIAILHTICLSDRSKWKEMRDDENSYRTISQLAENGNSRAKRKATGILERLNKTFQRTHTA